MKLSPKQIEVLSSCMSFEGNTAKIVSQLPRKEYTEVDKVLQALGGKWDRRMKSHIFPENAFDLVNHVLNVGEVSTSKEMGFFETPSRLAKTMVEMIGVNKGDCVLEPSAGEGAICEAIINAGGRLWACEYDEGRRELLRKRFVGEESVYILNEPNFFNIPMNLHVDKVVMNPPFAKVKGVLELAYVDCYDHLTHAMKILKNDGKLVCVLPAGIKFRQDKRHSELREYLSSVGEFRDLPAGTFNKSGTGVSTVLYFFYKKNALQTENLK